MRLRLGEVGALGALAVTAHTLVNLRRLRVPPPGPATAHVSVLLAVRDEEQRIGACLRALLAARGVARLDILIGDDDSTDATLLVAQRVAGADPRVRLVALGPAPPGWLGKPNACQQLADQAGGEVLVFLDADVVLAPDGLARAVAALDGPGGSLDLVSPYPRQRAGTAATRLVQPLLAWSWASLLPLGAAAGSSRPSLAVANGQLLVVRAAAYRAAGGHAAVRGAVLEDIALARAVVRSGHRVGLADGTRLADCEMYSGWAQLRDGYSKSLWAAFGSPAGAAAVLAGLALAYLAPAVTLVRHRSPLAAAGVAAGIAGRAVVAHRVGAPVWPDSAAHPLSVLALGYLTARSHVLYRRGRLRWRGRPVVAGATARGTACG